MLDKACIRNKRFSFTDDIVVGEEPPDKPLAEKFLNLIGSTNMTKEQCVGTDELPRLEDDEFQNKHEEWFLNEIEIVRAVNEKIEDIQAAKLSDFSKVTERAFTSFSFRQQMDKSVQGEMCNLNLTPCCINLFLPMLATQVSMHEGNRNFFEMMGGVQVGNTNRTMHTVCLGSQQGKQIDHGDAPDILTMTPIVAVPYVAFEGDNSGEEIEDRTEVLEVGSLFGHRDFSGNVQANFEFNGKEAKAFYKDIMVSCIVQVPFLLMFSLQ